MDEPLDGARRLYQSGRYRKAAEAYRRILAADPDNALAHYGLAACLIAMFRDEEAIRACERALALRPHWALPHVALASIHWRRRRDDLAMAELETALRLDPHLVAAHLLRGEILLARRDLRGALQAFRTAFQLQPSLETGWSIFLIFASRSKMIWLFPLLLIPIFSFRSILTLPLFVAFEAFLILDTWYAFRSAQREKGWVLFICGLIIALLYIHHLRFGL